MDTSQNPFLCTCAFDQDIPNSPNTPCNYCHIKVMVDSFTISKIIDCLEEFDSPMEGIDCSDFVFDCATNRTKTDYHKFIQLALDYLRDERRLDRVNANLFAWTLNTFNSPWMVLPPSTIHANGVVPPNIQQDENEVEDILEEVGTGGQAMRELLLARAFAEDAAARLVGILLNIDNASELQQVLAQLRAL
ncbi:hypothetical protein FH972_024470 [Carpinus fangiana]|uniref:Uncharacterized protein n=1 Tax=Carpinus fangiana TaxID=176857 RepID=A0A5N6KY44_9ROSI|nr:hypothetical protein FH972_024470 [Carpinus fangiana]